MQEGSWNEACIRIYFGFFVEVNSMSLFSWEGWNLFWQCLAFILGWRDMPHIKLDSKPINITLLAAFCEHTFYNLEICELSRIFELNCQLNSFRLFLLQNDITLNLLITWFTEGHPLGVVCQAFKVIYDKL